MMLVLALLAMAAAEPSAAKPAAVAPPTAAPSAAEPAGDDTATSLAGLQQMYDQSCAAREYGAYDDLCDQLSQQLRAARVQADRAARRKASDFRHHPLAKPPQAASAAGPS